jgi:predicted transcriptional regulator
MNLKEYIEDTGISVTKLAERSNVPKQTIYNLLNGRDVRGSVLVKVHFGTRKQVPCEEMVDRSLLEKKCD